MIDAMTTLYLTSSEELVFATLPEALREGWTIEQEALSYTDTPLKRTMRLSLLRLHDPILVQLHKEIGQAKEPREMVPFFERIDFSHIDGDDLAELFFAVGPEVLSEVIAHLLSAARTDTEVEAVTALTVIRHALLQSFHPARQ